MYRLIKENFSGRTASVGKELPEVFITIPFDPANSDFQTFKRDLTEGVELQDAEGNVMTADQVTAFLGTLP